MLVAGRSGDLFVTENYAASAGSITWKRMATPVAGMLQIARIAIVPQTQGAAHLYFAAYPAGSVRSDGTGVYFSTDDGVTWQNIIADARPCTLATDIVPSASAEGRIYLPLWSGGVYELTLTETTDP